MTRSISRTGVAASAALLALVHAPAALAQNDLEYRDAEVEGDGKLKVEALFETQWHEFNNADFRRRDESSDQAILDSDDRDAFAFTGIAAELAYDVDPQVRFVLGASHRGLWGNDQLGTTNVFGGWIFFTGLFAELRTGTSDQAATFRVGRQFFTIGGLPNEFVLADHLDMIRVDVPFGGIGHVTLVPINVVSQAGSDNQADFYSYIGQSTVETFGFRGEHMTRRHGLVLALDGITDGLDLRGYAFYTDIGALGTGSDISYDGRLGNFADNDWTANYGVRGSFAAGPVTPYVTFDGSLGVDRKELVAQDVDTNGFAWGAGLAVRTGDDDSGLRANLDYYDAFGPLYTANGLIYSHGYVGMKAQQVGGTLSNRFLGWHPTSYVGLFGIDDSPHETDRKSGTRTISGRIGYRLPKTLTVSAAYWFMQDTGRTRVDFDRLDTIDPPFGYARDEFAAEARLGKVLAQEIDLDLGLRFGEHLEFTANGALLLPGAFYKTEIARVAGSALGSEDAVVAWAANGGMRVRF